MSCEPNGSTQGRLLLTEWRAVRKQNTAGLSDRFSEVLRSLWVTSAGGFCTFLIRHSCRGVCLFYV